MGIHRTLLVRYQSMCSLGFRPFKWCLRKPVVPDWFDSLFLPHWRICSDRFLFADIIRMQTTLLRLLGTFWWFLGGNRSYYTPYIRRNCRSYLYVYVQGCLVDIILSISWSLSAEQHVSTVSIVVTLIVAFSLAEESGSASGSGSIAERTQHDVQKLDGSPTIPLPPRTEGEGVVSLPL